MSSSSPCLVFKAQVASPAVKRVVSLYDFHHMSVAPMTAAPRQVIDLTLDEPVTTALAAGTNASQLSCVNKQQPYLNVVPGAGEPPTKKRRLGPEWAQQDRETAKTLVQKLLLPHVVRAVDRLSPQLYDVDQIAVEVCICSQRHTAWAFYGLGFGD